MKRIVLFILGWIALCYLLTVLQILMRPETVLLVFLVGALVFLILILIRGERQ